ncbi:MAG TPA: AMP-binding protein, partial [Solirubrobacteraceae bacterium]
MGKVCSGDRTVGSDELVIRAARVAAGLESLGIGAGDGVAIYLRNDIAFFEAALGASSLGAYPVAVNWHYTEEEARYVLEDSEAKAIVIHADLLPRVRGAIPDGVHVLVVRTPGEILEAYGIAAELGNVPAGELDWDRWYEQFEPRTTEPVGTTLSIIYTSGTTGHPKGVKRPPYTPEEIERITASLAVIFGLGYFGDPSEIVTAVVGPVYHAAPNSHASFSFRAGASIHLMPRFD